MSRKPHLIRLLRRFDISQSENRKTIKNSWKSFPGTNNILSSPYERCILSALLILWIAHSAVCIITFPPFFHLSCNLLAFTLSNLTWRNTHGWNAMKSLLLGWMVCLKWLSFSNLGCVLEPGTECGEGSVGLNISLLDSMLRSCRRKGRAFSEFLAAMSHA